VPTVPEVFSLALHHHQAGNIDQAERLYRQILEADPGHADSHHLLGVAHYQKGCYGPALTSILQAISLNAWAGVYYSNLGVVQEALGQLEQALASFQKALSLLPNSAEAHNAVGSALRAVGRLDESLAYCNQALSSRPHFPEAHNNLGNALYLKGKLNEALAQYQEALRLRPDFPEAHGHLGLVLTDMGRVAQALAHFRESLRLNPNNSEVHNNYSIALLKENKLEEAEAHCRRALELQANFAGAHNNLSIVLRRQGRLEDARAHGVAALAAQPKFPEAENSLATAHLRLGNWDEAMVHYDRAVQLKSEFPEARWNRALLLLLRGDFKNGWPEYEWRWTQPGFTRRHSGKPLWDGSNLDGRTILVYSEQGLGDVLHFIRYIPLVKQRCRKVVVECQPALARLLASCHGIDQVVPEGSQLPAFDVQVPLLSLPRIFQTDLATIPAQVPYLHPDAKLLEQWRQELEPLEGLKIGVAWQGSPTYGYDNLRSMALIHFARLAQVENVQLISLQKGPGTEQLAALGDRFPVLDLTSRLDQDTGPFADTAAIMKNVDLVISSDTAIPHLAGALGVPIWVAVPRVPDWRWLLEREDSPWYPTMRLFRQRQSGFWEDVFERMADELTPLAAAKRPRPEQTLR
jgi:tetratricopeptide (TPR) repeat protein